MAFTTNALAEKTGGFELALEGKVYADVAPQLRAVLTSAADRGLRSLVVDGSKLEQIDSAGLGVFVDLLKKVRPGGGKIVFYGLNGNIERVFAITNLWKVIQVVKTRQDALGALS
jgi:anti-anti-sigma factor